MFRALWFAGLCGFLTGCFAPGSGTVPRLSSARSDARVVTSVSTEIDRSAVPHNNRIHRYDAQVRFNVARYDPQTRHLTTPATELFPEYSQFLNGSDFNEFQLAWSGVPSGTYTISRVYQDAPVSQALSCVSDDGTLLPGVIPVPVNPGDVVYFGHVTITMKVFPAIDGGVTHPAKLVGIRFESRPAGLDAELRKAGIDPAGVRFIPHVDSGCRLGSVRRSRR